ncbi:MAG: phosphoserine transaminase [Deltaproteobacteria bacterium]|nr:phosphoserine transaminase [Deltaproteobacteria bacterium]
MSNINFSSGPCAKRPGWSLSSLSGALVGRSHRSAAGKEKLSLTIKKSQAILGIPENYLLGIMPASDTGAFEAAMWSMLGPRPVTVLVWESFSEGWATDITKHLKLNANVVKAPYGEISNLQDIDWNGDVVFVANGTTSGVKIPHWNWIPDNREGLSFCDATSAVFAQQVDWSKIDVLTFSWQKCLGSEAAHGMLVLSPRAVARIEAYDPPWPLPKIFRLKKKGKVDLAIFAGDTINTPSMLCLEDYLDALSWTESIGGLSALIAKSEANLALVEEWVARTPWVDFLAREKAIRSNTSVCLSVTDSRVAQLEDEARNKLIKAIISELGKEKMGYDIGSYKDAPVGFRIWCGPTVEAEDIKRLLQALNAKFNEKLGEVK